MKRVLIVDDEAKIRRNMKIGLSCKGCDASEASTGFEGIQLIRAVRPDILLLDLGQPDMDASSLRVHISSLGKKIEADSSRPCYLLAEPGIGYRLCGDE